MSGSRASHPECNRWRRRDSGRRRHRAPRRRGDRALSDLVGFVIIFSMIVTVVAVVSVAGMGSLEAVRDTQQTDNAVQAMQVLSDNLGDVHERGAPSRATEISLSDASVHVADPIAVEVRDPNDGTGDDSFLTHRVFKVRPIVYDDGDTKLVSVMGALFREQQRGGVVIQSWSPVLDSEWTYVPVVNTRSATGGQQSISSSTVLVRAVANERVVEVADEDGSYDDIWINVTSPRTELWRRMLNADPSIACPPSDQTPGTARCALDYTPERIYVVDTRIAVELEQ